MSITQFAGVNVESIHYRHLRYAVLVAGDMILVPTAPWAGEYRFVTGGTVHLLSDGRWGGEFTFTVIDEAEALALHAVSDLRLFQIEHPDARCDHDYDPFFGLGGFLDPGGHSITRFGAETRHGEILFFLGDDSTTPYRCTGMFDKTTLKRARWEQSIVATIAQAQQIPRTPRLVPVGHPTNIGVFIPHIDLIEPIQALAPLPPIPDPQVH